jgi:aryl-alcohol dehydrogenase-like predicted oxidoreductase
MNYGATNESGQTDPQEAGRILREADAGLFGYLDTAPSYGNSESVVGRYLGNNPLFKVVTKTQPIECDGITAKDADKLRETFLHSLKLLGQPSVYGLLFHRVKDLLSPNGQLLFSAAEELKRQGLVKKLGVSVYSPEEAAACLEHFPCELIQAPCNVLDQRLMHDGFLSRWQELGVEVHLRSVFLQGTLLVEPPAVPPSIAGAREQLEGYRAWCRSKGLSLLEAALGFGLRTGADCIIIGACNMVQLNQITAAYRSAIRRRQEPLDYTPFACGLERVVNPSLWHKI